MIRSVFCPPSMARLSPASCVISRSTKIRSSPVPPSRDATPVSVAPDTSVIVSSSAPPRSAMVAPLSVPWSTRIASLSAPRSTTSAPAADTRPVGVRLKVSRSAFPDSVTLAFRDSTVPMIVNTPPTSSVAGSLDPAGGGPSTSTLNATSVKPETTAPLSMMISSPELKTTPPKLEDTVMFSSIVISSASVSSSSVEVSVIVPTELMSELIVIGLCAVTTMSPPELWPRLPPPCLKASTSSAPLLTT